MNTKNSPNFEKLKNPLSGRTGRTAKLLQALDDEDLLEYCRYWQGRWQRCRDEGDGFTGWECSKRLSEGCREVSRRGIDAQAVTTGHRP